MLGNKSMQGNVRSTDTTSSSEKRATSFEINLNIQPAFTEQILNRAIK